MAKRIVLFLFFFLFLGNVNAQVQPKNRGKIEFKKDKLPRKFTRATFDSTHSFDVLHYRLNLMFPFSSSAFSGTITVTCRSCVDGLDKIQLDMVDLVADSVFLWKEKIDGVQKNGEITISLGKSMAIGDTFSVSIAYNKASQEENSYRGFYYYSMCAYTMSEPEDARYWFPCFDKPWDKATAELYVTVPRDVEVASIGLLEKKELSEDGKWETFHWRTEYPVATYLICVTMSKFYSRWSDWYVSPAGDSLEIVYYVFTRDSVKAKNDFVHMVDAVSFFSDRFGPYPFEKYGMAEVEPFYYGGMEHQTMTTFNSQWIQGNRAYESGFVHELSHMWWGDAVTLNNWPAIWLNEGFAVYSEALFIEHEYGQDAFQEKMDNVKNNYFFQTNSRDFPIYDPPAGELFNWGIIYNKGAWVLHMLRHVVGDENFWKILKTYYTTYRYSNASISEFKSVCESVSGMDLYWFFDEWIYNKGCPDLEYSWSSRFLSQNKYEVTLIIDQVQADAPLFQMPLDVRIDQDGVSKDTTVWISEYSQSFVFLTNNQPKSIILDPDKWVLMKSEYKSGIKLREGKIPDHFALLPNFPNPFNARTTIYYDLPASRAQWNVHLVVYNVRGECVRTLIERSQPPGRYWVSWDGSDSQGKPLSTGIYILKLYSNGFEQEKKAVLIK